ncbi:sensor histidine kinase [Bdellovibrio svalbardensis]|uniref:histidine kinase n=1 Tax=Bdellovibrio svalbardensis TaxID=2972972 RepID=A0ABT6DI59_9BACT|nr:HAMP domain-containing sensor histidine kinase [Bdellovibrio svalbardensis]MDG0816536.1 HAMP domain-containing histidine kinase [Bdellovibrio svalbardensis]
MDRESYHIVKALRNLSKVDQLLYGEDYIRELVQHIAQELNVKYVMVGHAIEPERTKIQTDFMWAEDHFTDNVIYELNGTPCVNVICGTRASCYVKDVAKIFPKDQMLTDLKIESYIGAPFLHTDGSLIGLLVIMDDREIENTETMTAVTEFFAARIGTEYRRIAFEDSLQRINEKLEQQVQERTNELRMAFKNLQRTQQQMISQEKLATIGRITFGIAHELKNPLNVIINSAEILEELEENELNPNHLRELSHMIHEHGERANSIITSMLKQARQDTESEPEIIDLSELINHSLDMCIRSLSDLNFKSKLTLQKNILPHIKVRVINPSSIERAFINIFDNSLYALRKKLNHSPKDSFKPELSVNLTTSDQSIDAVIRDNGTGISEKHLLNLFREFYTTKPPGEGTGLGLSIAKSTLTKNFGDISISSREGIFTEVNITLPLVPGLEEQP